MRRKKFAEALAAVDHAIELSPENHLPHFLKGQILLRMDREQEAKKEIEVAQRLARENLKQARNKYAEGMLPNPELTRRPE